MTVRDEVSIAGVPWPVYKLLALAIGFMVLVIVALTTASAAPSVLAAAASGTVVWLALGRLPVGRPLTPSSSRRSVSRSAATAEASESSSASVIPARRRTVNNTSQRGSPTPPGITRIGLYTASPDGSRTT